MILSVRARARQGSSKNQETEGGPGQPEKLEGSMKEGCVREFVKGGVCERHRDGERHWHPVSAKISSIQSASRVGSPRRSPESLPCWSPQIHSPQRPCLVRGRKIQWPQKKRGVREKQGSVGLAMAWCIPSQQADWLLGPPRPIPGPLAPQTLALRQQESRRRSSNSVLVL